MFPIRFYQLYAIQNVATVYIIKINCILLFSKSLYLYLMKSTQNLVVLHRSDTLASNGFDKSSHQSFSSTS